MGAPKSAVEDEPEFAFTSMIDIVFLLLIFFILQPFKSMERRLDNELPQDEGPSDKMDTKITCRLVITKQPGNEKAANYFINSKPICTSANYQVLANALIRDVGGDKTTSITLAPTADVHFLHVIRALDQCHVAGMVKVSFEAPPPPKSQS